MIHRILLVRSQSYRFEGSKCMARCHHKIIDFYNLWWWWISGFQGLSFNLLHVFLWFSNGFSAIAQNPENSARFRFQTNRIESRLVWDNRYMTRRAFSRKVERVIRVSGELVSQANFPNKCDSFPWFFDLSSDFCNSFLKLIIFPDR